jgi:hypothetical protein
MPVVLGAGAVLPPRLMGLGPDHMDLREKNLLVCFVWTTVLSDAVMRMPARRSYRKQVYP